MPLLVRLQLCRVYIYARDHNPPHVHVRTPDGDAAVAIRGQRLLAGEVDRRAMREATEWIARNADVLEEIWDELRLT